MLDKTKLSKQKYIYCVYAGKDGPTLGSKLHVERFPIVYINSKYVHFKLPGDEALDLKSLDFVKDSLESLSGYEIDSLRYTRQYFWSVGEDLPETLNDIRKKHEQTILEEKKNQAKLDLEETKKLYDRALADYRKYEEA